MDKIIITRSMHPFVAKKLSIHHNVWQNTSSSPITRKELLKRMARCNGLLCTPYDVIDSEIIDAAPDLRTISTFSVGYDHIDVKYAKSRNISIGYTPDVLSEATANMAFALILDITRGVSHGDRIIRSDKWKNVFAPQDLCGIELSGKTLGILGMGRIGTLVAERASSFGMKIYSTAERLCLLLVCENFMPLMHALPQEYRFDPCRVCQVFSQIIRCRIGLVAQTKNHLSERMILSPCETPRVMSSIRANAMLAVASDNTSGVYPMDMLRTFCTPYDVIHSDN